MKSTTLILSLAAALSLTLAGCDRNTAPTPAPKTGESVQPATPPQPSTNTPAPRSSAGGSSASSERKTPTAINGQVDTGDNAQKKDFQTNGK